MKYLLNELELQMQPNGDVNIKPLILAACGNMFSQYMCSARFQYTDPTFQIVVRRFDEIFWEINQGYAVDFLPWLQPFYDRHLNTLSDWAHEIRQFILERIIEEHRVTLDRDSPPRDFTDALLMHLEQDPSMNWQHIMFELEDFLGGHSAVGNLVMLVLAAVVHHPEVIKLSLLFKFKLLIMQKYIQEQHYSKKDNQATFLTLCKCCLSCVKPCVYSLKIAYFKVHRFKVYYCLSDKRQLIMSLVY